MTLITMTANDLDIAWIQIQHILHVQSGALKIFKKTTKSCKSELHFYLSIIFAFS